MFRVLNQKSLYLYPQLKEGMTDLQFLYRLIIGQIEANDECQSGRIVVVLIHHEVAD